MKNAQTLLFSVITCPPNSTHEGMHIKNYNSYYQSFTVWFPRRQSRFLCENVPMGKKKGKKPWCVSHKQKYFELSVPKLSKTCQYETWFPVKHMGSFLLGTNTMNIWEDSNNYSYESSVRIIFGFMYQLPRPNKLWTGLFGSFHWDPKAKVTSAKIVHTQQQSNVRLFYKIKKKKTKNKSKCLNIYIYVGQII